MQANLAEELVLFKNAVESIIKGSSSANKIFEAAVYISPDTSSERQRQFTVFYLHIWIYVKITLQRGPPNSLNSFWISPF